MTAFRKSNALLQPDSQLPEGLTITGYDSDTGRRHYQDSTGAPWVGLPYTGVANDRPVRVVVERPTRIPSRPAVNNAPIVSTPPPPPKKPKTSLSSFLRPKKSQTLSVAEPVNHEAQPIYNGSRFSLTNRRRRAGGSESSNHSYDSDSRPSYLHSLSSSPIILHQPPTESPTQVQLPSPPFSHQRPHAPSHEKGCSYTLPTNLSPTPSVSAVCKDHADSKQLPDLWEQKDSRDLDHQPLSEEIKDSAGPSSENLRPQTEMRSRFPSLPFYMSVLGINLASVLLVIFASAPKR